MAGYLGAIPVPQATQHRESFTATSGQTTFNTAGYTVGFLDVYLNGSHLSPADFTATNGSDVVLASGASADDVCDIISYTAFEVADQTFTGTTTMDVAAITGVLTTTAATVFNGGFTANAASTISTDGNEDTLVLKSNDADANSGPKLQFNRNSANPADGDDLGEIRFSGRNDAGQAVDYLKIYTEIIDASDGTEDGRFTIDTMLAGTSVDRMQFNSAETIFNQDSANLDFRVESNGNANMLFVDGGNDAVGIGTSSPSGVLDIRNGTTQQVIIGNSGSYTGSEYGELLFKESSTELARVKWNPSGNTFQLINKIAGPFTFATNNTERMRLDASGNLLVGKTTTSLSEDGVKIQPSGQVNITQDSADVLRLNRKTSDGTIIDLRKDGSTVGSIGFVSTGAYIQGETDHSGFRLGGSQIVPFRNGADTDNTTDLGASGTRFDDIFATNGTIQTSDHNEKQDIASLTSAEMLVAKRISALFKTFRWKDKVAAKGANARTHTGIIAQDVQAAFTAEGLDAGDYSLFISSTWWEHNVDVPAVEAADAVYEDVVIAAVEEELDEEGNVLVEAQEERTEQRLITEAVEAKDAYTRTDTYDTQSEAPEGATSKTRMGIRYPELLSFVAAYNEQRFAAIETRLTALEG